MGEQEYEARISAFKGTCLEFDARSHWWSFDYCVQSTVLQYHKGAGGEATDSHYVGTYSHRTKAGDTMLEHYGHGEQCELQTGQTVQRSAAVVWRCCGKRQRDQQTTFIE